MKNTAALVLGLLGAIFGAIGGIMGTMCADACASVGVTSGLYTVLFIVLGIGGAVVGLVGAIKAYGMSKIGFTLLLIGLLCEIGYIVAMAVMFETFIFTMSAMPIVSVILFAVACVVARKKA